MSLLEFNYLICDFPCRFRIFNSFSCHLSPFQLSSLAVSSPCRFTLTELVACCVAMKVKRRCYVYHIGKVQVFYTWLFKADLDRSNAVFVVVFHFPVKQKQLSKPTYM